MTRRALALAALWLLACSPPADPGDAADGSVSAQAESVSIPSASHTAQQRRDRAAKPAPKAAAQAETGGAYQYVDESGRVQFAARLSDVPERQRSTAAPVAVAPASPRRTSAPAPDREEHRATTEAQVIVYTTRTCGYCRAAMAYMDKIGQDYENRDVEADEDARSEYLELTGGERGVPVIVVGRDWMQGWSQSQFDKLVAKAQ
jgi:glutaredoxin